MYKSIIFIAGISILLASAHAVAKSYTKEELHQMIKKKKYPKVGAVQNQSSSEMEFDKCEKFVSQFVTQIAGAGWPTKTITEKNNHYEVNAWQRDVMLTFECKNGMNYGSEFPYEYGK